MPDGHDMPAASLPRLPPASAGPLLRWTAVRLIRDHWWALYLMVVSAAAFAAFGDWAFDDPFITYRYSANLLAGRGFVYNPGLRVLSTTTPLYALLLALVGLAVPDLPLTSNLLGAVSLAAGGLILHRLSHRRQSPAVGWAALLLYPTWPLLYTTLGGEMPLYLLFCLGTLLAYAEARYALVGVLGGLALLSRADAGVLLALLGLWHLLRRPRQLPWRALAALGIVILPWVLFAWSYFGSPLPVTLAAKQHQARLPGCPSFAAGFVQLVSGYSSYWQYWMAAALAGLGIIYAAGWHRRWLLVLAWPVAYFVSYAALGVSRYFWYYAPLVPGVVVAIGLGAAACQAVLSRLTNRWLGGLLAIVLLVLFAAFHVGRLEWLRSRPDHRVLIYRAAGEWLRQNTPGESSVGTLEVGIIGYYSMRPMVDFAGLIQPEVAQRLGPDFTYEDAALWAVEQYRPDYLVLNPTWFPRLMERHVSPSCRVAHMLPGADRGYEGDLVIYQCTGEW